MSSTTGVTTLNDLLSEPTLRLTCLVQARGLDRPVRWAHSTELTDPSAYLTGGELVCSVGTGLSTEESIRTFVASVAAAGAIGICFGVGDVVAEVPDDLIQACRMHEMVLLAAPHGMPFRAISELLVQRRTDADADAHVRMQQLTSELLLGLRAHQPIPSLLDLAGERLGGVFSVTAIPEVPVPADSETIQRSATVDDLTLSWSGPEPAPDPSFMETLTRLLAVATHERDIEKDLRRERIGELLSLVADRLASPAALEVIVDNGGIPRDCVVFSLWPPGAGRLLEATIQAEPHVIGETPTATVLLTGAQDVAHNAGMQLGLPFGFSRPNALTRSARALGEASAAFDLAQRRGTSIGPDDLTTLEGLLAQQPPERLAPFVDLLLDPLIQSDRGRRTGFVSTLRAYFANNASLVDTARAEFLHVNTVRHRLERIHDITGRDPMRLVDRADLLIALWAHDHRGL